MGRISLIENKRRLKNPVIQRILGRPCLKLSIPYWKVKRYMPRIVHNLFFSGCCLHGYMDERGVIPLKEYEVRRTGADDMEMIVSIIHQLYVGIRISKKQMGRDYFSVRTLAHGGKKKSGGLDGMRNRRL